MLPGPTEIVACPHCGDLAQQYTLASGNTYGARLWSDGKLEAPMLPESAAFTRCRKCRKLYWLVPALVIGEIEPWGETEVETPEAWRHAKDVRDPGLGEYAQALRLGMGDTRERERFLRIRYWWLFNDPQRIHPDDPRPKGKQKGRDAEAHAARMDTNLAKLASLLDARNPSDRLMKAEVLRQSGKFSKAIALLEKIPKQYQDLAAKLLELARKDDRIVRPLDDPEEETGGIVI